MNCSVCNRIIISNTGNIIGICQYCREKHGSGWQVCKECACYSIPPGCSGDVFCMSCSNPSSNFLYEIYCKKYGISKAKVADTIQDKSIAVNDYVCLSCKNDKCSKTEKSCWKCGTAIKN